MLLSSSSFSSSPVVSHQYSLSLKSYLGLALSSLQITTMPADLTPNRLMTLSFYFPFTSVSVHLHLCLAVNIILAQSVPQFSVELCFLQGMYWGQDGL